MIKEEVAILFHSNEDVADYIEKYAVINHKPIDACFDDAVIKEYCKYYISKGDNNANTNSVVTNWKERVSNNCS